MVCTSRTDKQVAFYVHSQSATFSHFLAKIDKTKCAITSDSVQHLESGAICSYGSVGYAPQHYYLVRMRPGRPGDIVWRVRLHQKTSCSNELFKSNLVPWCLINKCPNLYLPHILWKIYIIVCGNKNGFITLVSLIRIDCIQSYSELKKNQWSAGPKHSRH